MRTQRLTGASTPLSSVLRFFRSERLPRIWHLWQPPEQGTCVRGCTSEKVMSLYQDLRSESSVDSAEEAIEVATTSGAPKSRPSVGCAVPRSFAQARSRHRRSRRAVGQCAANAKRSPANAIVAVPGSMRSAGRKEHITSGYCTEVRVVWDTAVRFFLLPLRVSAAGMSPLNSCKPRKLWLLCPCQASRLSSSRPQSLPFQHLPFVSFVQVAVRFRLPKKALQPQESDRDSGGQPRRKAARPPLQLCWREADFSLGFLASFGSGNVRASG